MKNMGKKISDVEIEIKSLEFPNKGIGIYEGKKIIVKNTIPGQIVKVDIKRKKGNFEGRLTEVVKKADYEIEPKCRVFGLCGGCTYQNVEYEKELEFKKNNVLKLLENENLGEYEFLKPEKCPSAIEYRNKMEFSFGDTGVDGDLSLGMRKRMSYYEVVNANECLIIHSDIRKVLSTVLDFFKSSNETFYHKTKKIGTLRHLLVRRGFFTGELMVNLVTTSSFKTDLKPLKDKILSLELDGNLTGFLHTINDSVADIVKADELRIIYGRDYIYEKLLGLKFKISVFSFFQTNSQGAEVLYSIVKDFAGEKKNKIIFDLYCGTGTIAQILSPMAEYVIGIEIVEEAVEAAKINAKLNDIKNCQFIAGDVLKIVDSLVQKPDLIVLDPPREGIHPKAIGRIINFGAQRLIYISCKASSMAKDLKKFVDNGYKIEKMKCVDMFARTGHVETVVLMSKVK